MSTSARRHRHSNRRGYTLLEVVLSLVLVSLVLLCVTAAVDTQMRIGNAGRLQVEEAQLARTLLHRIADDLRGTVPYHAIRTSAMSTTSGSASTSSGENGGSSNSSDSSAADSAATVLSTGGTPMAVSDIPGIYGGEDWLQVDIARLSRPRRATPSSVPGEDDPAGVAGGDLKAVAYYLATAATEPQTPGSPPSGGLVRRELDRVLMTGSGGAPKTDQARLAETVLAPEVTGLRFNYSDGYDWFTSWDTSDSKALPQLIEIVLTLQTAQGPLDYRLTVDVPAARSGCLPEVAVMTSGGGNAVSTTYGSEAEGSSESATKGESTPKGKKQ